MSRRIYSQFPLLRLSVYFIYIENYGALVRSDSQNSVIFRHSADCRISLIIEAKTMFINKRPYIVDEPVHYQALHTVSRRIKIIPVCSQNSLSARLLHKIRRDIGNRTQYRRIVVPENIVDDEFVFTVLGRPIFAVK